MPQKKQSPGMPAQASRDPIVEVRSSVPFSVVEQQAQTFVSRFLVSRSVARNLAILCFGEVTND